MRPFHTHRIFIAITAVAWLSSCASGDDTNTANTVTPATLDVCIADAITVPVNFNQPVTSCNNVITLEKTVLGRFLFYDRDMSFNQTQSCADCHQQDRAFTDGLVTSTGSTGEIHPRNSMSLANVVFNTTQNWHNPNIRELHSQALAVLQNESPIELGWAGVESEIIDRFRTVKNDALAGTVDYPAMFAAAFPDEADPYTIFNFTRAVGAFVASMISGNSEYDKNQRGEPNTMSAAAKRGLDLFFSESLECFHCHGGYNFSGPLRDENTAFLSTNFQNNGLYNVDADNDGNDGEYPASNPGLFEFTFREEDKGKFRVPTLRNIELTAPYMHDGSIATLDETIDHYARGGRLITVGPDAGDGALNPHKSSFVIGFALSANEKLDLMAFLTSLTDWEFICNPGLSDPFGNIPLHPACP